MYSNLLQLDLNFVSTAVARLGSSDRQYIMP